MAYRILIGSQKPAFQKRSQQMSKLQFRFLHREMGVASGYQPANGHSSHPFEWYLRPQRGLAQRTCAEQASQIVIY